MIALHTAKWPGQGPQRALGLASDGQPNRPTGAVVRLRVLAELAVQPISGSGYWGLPDGGCSMCGESTIHPAFMGAASEDAQ